MATAAMAAFKGAAAKPLVLKMGSESTGKAFPIAEEGSRNAVCVDFCDLGVEASTFNEGKDQHQAYFVWQVEERTEHDKPIIS